MDAASEAAAHRKCSASEVATQLVLLIQGRVHPRLPIVFLHVVGRQGRARVLWPLFLHPPVLNDLFEGALLLDLVGLVLLVRERRVA